MHRSIGRTVPCVPLHACALRRLRPCRSDCFGASQSHTCHGLAGCARFSFEEPRPRLSAGLVWSQASLAEQLVAIHAKAIHGSASTLEHARAVVHRAQLWLTAAAAERLGSAEADAHIDVRPSHACCCRRLRNRPMAMTRFAGAARRSHCMRRARRRRCVRALRGAQLLCQSVLPVLLVAAGRGAAHSYAANAKAQPRPARATPLAPRAVWTHIGGSGGVRCYQVGQPDTR